MKTQLTILVLLWTFCLAAQNVDNIGTTDHPELNKEEAKLLNSLLQLERDTFDFMDKKVAFLTGSKGRAIAAKSDYFKNAVLPWVEEESRPQISMVILTKDEKEKSGGYDVLVLSWVKAFTRRAQRKVIEELGEQRD